MPTTRGDRRPTRSRRTASRSSPRSATASASRACTSRSRRVVLRYFNVFGPRQSPFSQYAAAVPLFITKIAAGEPIDVYGDGEQSRDFTYVGNVVDATMRAGEADGASGEIFNVAAGSPASVNHVADDDRRDPRQAGRSAASTRRAPATSGTPGPTSRSRSACSATSRRPPSRRASGERSSPALGPRGTLMYAFQAGLCLPVFVASPDCQPPRPGSSRTRNQSIMSMRGFLRAIA